MTAIHIKNARVIDPASNTDKVQDIYIQDCAIVGNGKPPAGFTATQQIDATGLIACPGLVDLSARLREPGQEHKATIASETLAAASAGITTLCCPPDTQPVIDHPAIAEYISHKAIQAGKSRVVTIGALTHGLRGEQLSEMAALQKAGCVGVSNVLLSITDTRILRRCFEYAATLGLTVFINAREPWLALGGCAHEGQISTRLGLPGVPETAETMAIAHALLLIKQTGVKAHFSQLSSGAAVSMLAEAQAQGLSVTADVAIHQLHLTEFDIGDFNTQCHVYPPLRSLRDQELLRHGVKQGIIKAICSDHQPHEADAKLLPFQSSAPGISGLETLLPLTLRLTKLLDISLMQTLRLTTQNPAAILGMTKNGLQPGQIADMCIFDPKYSWIVEPDKLVSKGHNTPFAGWEMQGKVCYTLCAGKIIYPS